MPKNQLLRGCLYLWLVWGSFSTGFVASLIVLFFILSLVVNLPQAGDFSDPPGFGLLFIMVGLPLGFVGGCITASLAAIFMWLKWTKNYEPLETDAIVLQIMFRRGGFGAFAPLRLS